MPHNEGMNDAEETEMLRAAWEELATLGAPDLVIPWPPKEGRAAEIWQALMDNPALRFELVVRDDDANSE